MNRACTRELPPLDVARGFHRCLRAQEPLALERSQSPAKEPGWPRRALSFLTEDDSDSWVALGDIPEAGPLSSTRRSLLDEPGDSDVPWLWPGCPQEHRGDTAVPLPPLASSTLLWDRDRPQEPPPSRTLGTRTGCPLTPSLGDIPVPCPRVAPGVSLRQHEGGILGTRAVSPRSLLARGGFSSCSVAPQSSGDIAGDTPGGWGGAVPNTGVTEMGGGDRAGSGDSSGSFVSARESLGASGAGGVQPGGPSEGAGPATPPRDLGQDLGWEGSRADPQIPESCSDVGGLLAPLGGCSLGGSPRCCPRPGSPGGVTPGDRDNFGDRHVTPRSRSRLRGVAARLRLCSSSSSSSSSLFPETLPTSPRPPGVAVTSPPGRCVPAGDRDVSGGDGEGTGGSWSDTQTVHGLSPGGGSAPNSGTGVLRGLGDKGHTQNSLSLARDSPRSSPWLWPVPGKRRHPQKSPPVTRGPPSATSSPRTEGGTGWQRHSPLGTSRSQRVLRHLLVPRPPGSASGELGTPSVPLSPGCATPHSESHQEDVTQVQAPCECHSPGGSPGRGTDATSSAGGSTGSGGRVSLWQPELGDNPGAVTELPRVEGLARGQRGWPKGHSPELVAALRTGHIPDCAQDELALSRHFEQPQRGRAGREGRLKCSFNYLLLDPRVTQDLPRRSPRLSPAQLFQDFVTAVFYVGKGTRARPWWHLRQARAQHQRGTHRGCPKVRRILEIWDSGQGVVPLQCFQHRVPAEAFTRESCMLEALGLQSLTNARRGPCYGVAAAWPAERRRRLGVSLLHRAMNVLLAQGECQLRPGDIPG